MRLRIGVHVGDAVEEADGDLMGDAVNIAARVEGVCEPGGVAVSEDAWRQAEGKVAVETIDLGAPSLKNIARPVRVFQLMFGQGRPTGDRASAAQPTPDTPVIAVLPFKNMSGDPEQDHFCDGLVDDILTTLSKVAGLRVIARHSSFAFKDRALDVREVGRLLGARYVLEGGMRKSGRRIRINAQLIDARDGAHVWAERYDRALDDIFAIQDEITLALATEMQVKLTEGEQARLRYSTTSNVEAWRRWVRGFRITGVGSPRTIPPPRQRLGKGPRARSGLGGAPCDAGLDALSRCALRLAGRSTEGRGEGPRLCRARACARSRQPRRTPDLGRIDVD